MNINISQTGNILVVAPFGELDHHSAVKLKERTDELLEKGEIKHLVLDLKGLSFMDSSGIGVIVGRYKKLSQVGGSVVLGGASHSAMRLFEIGGLRRIIPVYSSAQEAIKALTKK